MGAVRTGQEPLSSGEAGPTRLPGSSLGSLGVDRRVCLDVGETYGRRGRDGGLPTQHLLLALPYHQTPPHWAPLAALNDVTWSGQLCGSGHERGFEDAK